VLPSVAVEVDIDEVSVSVVRLEVDFLVFFLFGSDGDESADDDALDDEAKMMIIERIRDI
jgi:hypothetical protein